MRLPKSGLGVRVLSANWHHPHAIARVFAEDEHARLERRNHFARLVHGVGTLVRQPENYRARRHAIGNEVMTWVSEIRRPCSVAGPEGHSDRG